MISKEFFLDGSVHIRHITDFEYQPGEEMVVLLWNNDECISEWDVDSINEGLNNIIICGDSGEEIFSFFKKFRGALPFHERERNYEERIKNT